MKALVYEAPWQMPLREVAEPQPQPGEVIVAVRAVGVCGSDIHGFTGSTGRRIPPMIMGHEFSGEVTAVGAGVESWEPGARVTVLPTISCGTCANCRAGLPNICIHRSGLGMMTTDGAYADAVAVPARQLYSLPPEVSWEAGAMVEPLAVGMHAANLTPVRLMDPVLIFGAGTIGLLTLLAVRLKGAGTIIVTDLSSHRLEMARRLGADITVNPRETDLAAVVRQVAGPSGMPVVIEAVGAAATARQSLELVRPGGHVTWIGNSQPVIEVNMPSIVTREITIRGVYAFTREFGDAIEAIRSGHVDVMPLVEDVLPLAEGPRVVTALAKGELDAIKILLRP